MFGVKARKICDGVFMVGGPELSDARDCLCYLAAGPAARVLIDCGCGPSAGRIVDLASRAMGAAPSHLLLTHAHIDHAGGAAEVKRLCGCQVMLHRLEAEVLASGDGARSAADWYNLALTPLRADALLDGGEELDLGDGLTLKIIHTPGHTPGSLSAWLDASGLRVLFGQDLHGPFFQDFGSDLGQYAKSMEALLELRADILCEGHYGVFGPAESASAFMRQQLAANRPR